MMVQDNRRNFTYRYRDFQVRDLARFERNFRVTVVAGSEELVGRDCVVFDVEHRTSGSSSYRVHVDSRTALVLRSEERTESGQLVGIMEFESFELVTSSSQLANQALFALPATSLEARERIEFDVLEPQVIPAGYDLQHLTRHEYADPQLGVGQVWARYQYTNGVEHLFFLHRDQLPQLGSQPDKGEVMVFPVGGWNVVVGEVNRYPVILMGKVSSDELLEVLESVF